MLSKALAAFMTAVLVLLSPGTGTYQALAAVRVNLKVPAMNMPAGGQAGIAALHNGPANVSLSGALHLRLGPTLTTLTHAPEVIPAVAAGVRVLPQVQTVQVRPAKGVDAPAGIGRRPALKKLLSQGADIRAAIKDVREMPAANAHGAGVRIMDLILGVRSHKSAGADVVADPGSGFSGAGKLRESAAIGKDDRRKKAPPPAPPPGPKEEGAPLGPATAGGQFTAGLFYGALAAGAVYGAKYLAGMSLAGYLVYAPLAVNAAAVLLGAAAAGFLFLGARMVLSRTGKIEAGDTQPISKPYGFFQKGGLRFALGKPVEGENPIYIPSYGAWALRLHAKVRKKAGRAAAYFVQGFGNIRLLVGEGASLVTAVRNILPVIGAMYRGDKEVRPFVKPHRKSMWTLQGINIVQAVIGVAGSFVVGALVDSAMAGSTGMFSLLIGALLAIAAANLVLNTAYEWIKARVASDVLTDFRVKVFGHVLSLPFGFFNREKPSEISARLAVDVASLSAKNIGIPVVLPYYGAMALFSGIMMAITSGYITGLVAVIVPFLVLLSNIYGNKAEKLNEAQMNRRAEMISSAEETLSAVRDVRAFSTETVEKKRYEGRADSFIGTVMRKMRITSAYNGGMGQFYEFSFHILVLAVGLTSFMMAGTPTVGQTMALVGYAAFMRQALSGTLSVYTEYRETTGAVRRVLRYLKEESALSDARGAVDPGRLKGAVVFENVSYSHGGYPLLKNLDFEVKPGQHVAIVGGSPNSKSALLDLVGHLDDHDSGSVKFDGKETRMLKVAPLRRQVSLLHDKGIWIDGATVRDNLTYGLDAEVGDAAIAAAVKESGADFVLDGRRFPEGLDTVLNTDDRRLTDMRKKLLEVARARLADPRILLLDRPTGTLNDIEAGIVAARLDQLRRGRTSFTVDQKMDQAQFADLILVLKRGEIVEKGTHEELMALQGVYYQLWLSERAEDKAD